MKPKQFRELVKLTGVAKVEYADKFIKEKGEDYDYQESDLEEVYQLQEYGVVRCGDVRFQSVAIGMGDCGRCKTTKRFENRYAWEKANC